MFEIFKILNIRNINLKTWSVFKALQLEVKNGKLSFYKLEINTIC